MLKWFALLLVSTVLCWGEDKHSNSKNENDSRPVVESQSIETKENKIGYEDEDSQADKKDLTNLIKQLDSVTTPRQMGEQNSDSQTTTPNL
ncbi:MAG: hypothetical protein EXR74_09100 [Bdellovibrionales bacterium]|nr:hypothetical protein [Bdellovibrionales bacterium]